MKRINACIFLFLSMVWSSCAASGDGGYPRKTVFDVAQKVTGEIMVVGNEPFTRLAVRTENDKVYLLRCDEDTRQFLLSHQGKLVDIYYDEVDSNNSGDELRVVKANINLK